MTSRTKRPLPGCLSCADLGVCLHMSSSGVDLPMMVVNMFGSGQPVAAYANYECFGELVKEGVNGCGFETTDELAATLGRLFTEEGSHELTHLRDGACKEGSLRWDEEWDRVLGVAGKNLRDRLTQQQKFARMLVVDTAYHSPHMIRPAAEYVKASHKCGINLLASNNNNVS
ncbi:glycosyl transferase group 1 [Apiospora sp. TS-2023a]